MSSTIGAFYFIYQACCFVLITVGLFLRDAYGDGEYAGSKFRALEGRVSELCLTLDVQ